MASIFGSSQPKFIGADGSTEFQFAHSKILKDEAEYDTVKRESDIDGSRHFFTRSVNWIFEVRENLHKYTYPDITFDSLVEHLNTEVTLYAHADKEPFQDSSGENVAFYFESLQRFYADEAGDYDFIVCRFVSTGSISFYKPEFPVDMQLYRNEEMNNTLDVDDCTPITVTAIDTTNNVITLSWLPNVPTITNPGDDPTETTPGWCLELVEDDHIPNADESRLGDYSELLLITGGSYTNKTLQYTVARGSEANWSIGDKVALYNPYVGKWTWPATNPVIEENASAAWREDAITSGGMFLDASGDLVLLGNGYKASTGILQVGAFKADDSDWDSFTVMNSDAAVLVPGGSDWRADKIYSDGTVLQLDTDEFIAYCTGHNAGKLEIGWAKFNSAFSSVSYSSSEIIDSSGSSCGFNNATVIYHNGEYRMLYTDKDDNAVPESSTNPWRVYEAFSDLPEGPFVSSGEIIIEGRTGIEGSWRSGYVDSLHLFHYKGRLYMLAGGTATFAASGTRGNRVTGLYYFNETLSTPAWEEDVRSPIFINPIYGDVVWPDRDDNWASDHMGGRFSVVEHPTNGRLYLFMSCNYSSDTYTGGLIYIDIPSL